jgi:hypothetical protein
LIHKKTFEFLIAVRLFTAVVRATIRGTIVMVVICSWIAISSHCAFAAAACGPGCQPVTLHRQDADATQCPFHSKPAKQKQQNAQVQCCKVLRAVVSEPAKSWARDDANFSDVGIEERTLITCSLRPIAPLLLDIGPPSACSFAELILQQSLLAHAPPFLW